MTKQRIFFWLVALSLHHMVQAQGHDAHWIFGMGYHMEFVGGMPIMHPRVDSFVAEEGASCISDKDGNLLYYSNTQRVWNRDYKLLLNSDSINEMDHPHIGSSITNGSMFLPWPGDTSDRYYALLIRGESDRRVFVSRIDNSLDGGLGGIVPGFKNIPIVDFNVGEHLTAVRHGNGRDWWILTRRLLVNGPNTYAMVASLFTPWGIDTTIGSSIGLKSLSAGEMVASRTGTLLGLASTSEGDPWVGVFTFDKCSGEATLIDSIGKQNNRDTYYGIAFNKEGTKAYSVSSRNSNVYELDWTGSFMSAQLMFTLDSLRLTLPNNMGQLELGQDGLIYATFMYHSLAIEPNPYPIFTQYLGTINPALPIETAFDTFAILLPDTVNRTWSLPHFPNYELGALIGSPCDSLSPPVDTATTVTMPIPEQASWTVNPSVGRDRFVVTGVPAGAELVVYDAFGRKAGAWTVTNDPFTIQNIAWPPGLYWMVATLADGRQLPERRIVKTGS